MQICGCELSTNSTKQIWLVIRVLQRVLPYLALTPDHQHWSCVLQVTSDSVQYESGYEPLRYMINYYYKPQQYSNVTAEASERLRTCKRISDQITLLVYKPFRHMFKSHQHPKNYFNAYFNILSTCTSIFESWKLVIGWQYASESHQVARWQDHFSI